ncbi:MAG: BatD family protein [Bacteroidales bacterium]|nr:BatD family protein [Bacteroidales bacterium]
MRIILTYILIIITQFVFAQGHIFTTVKFNKKSVYVGEPIEVTVSVYTSTWFTKGVNPGNIKVNGAFSYYFRSVSMSRKINNKTYAGVEMLYYVIPFEDEDISFPVVTFQVETPDDGDYKGKKKSITTKAKKIIIKSIPRGFNKEQWLVTSSLSVSDKWIGNIKNVKVGDVLERKVSRNVVGTVSELIPPIVWDSINNTSLYPSASSVKNHKSKTSISSFRVDAVRYLFEKEGELIIPEMVFTYWNPYRNRQYKRTLKAIKINVLPNPNLGILVSIKDSLNAELIASTQKETEEEFSFMGLSLKQLIIYSVPVIILLYIVFRLLKWLFIKKRIIQHLKQKRVEYLNSEKYMFKKLVSTLKHKPKDQQVTAIYNWVDSLMLSEPSLQYLANNYGNKEFVVEVESFFNNKDKELSIKLLKQSRKNYLSNRNNQTKPIVWINP